MNTVFNKRDTLSVERGIEMLINKEKTLLRLTESTMRHFELLHTLEQKWKLFENEVKRLSSINIDFKPQEKKKVFLLDVEWSIFEESDKSWKSTGFDAESVSSTDNDSEYSYYKSCDEEDSVWSEDEVDEEKDRVFRKEAARLSYIHLIPAKDTQRQTFFENEAAVFRNILLKEDKYLLFSDECARLGSIAVEPVEQKRVYKARKQLQVLCSIVSSSEDIKKRVQVAKDYCFECEEDIVCFDCAVKEQGRLLEGDIEDRQNDEAKKKANQKEKRKVSIISPILASNSQIPKKKIQKGFRLQKYQSSNVFCDPAEPDGWQDFGHASSNWVDAADEALGFAWEEMKAGIGKLFGF